MSARMHRMALMIAGALVLAGSGGACAQAMSTRGSPSSHTSSVSPPPQTLGALAWIEKTHTRLGSFDSARAPSASQRSSSSAGTPMDKPGGSDATLGARKGTSSPLAAADPQSIDAPSTLQRLPSLLPASPLAGAGTYAHSQSNTLRMNPVGSLLPTPKATQGPCLGVIGSAQCAKQ